MHLLKKYPDWTSLTSWAESLYTPQVGIKTNPTRIVSIDLLRGIVMILMAIDHVRDYFHRDAFLYSPTDLSQTSIPLFFTRWITHFCAPIFVFLAGISAHLYGLKKGRKELSLFLWTRGLWLIFVEVMVLSLIKTFNFGFTYIILQVIWAIGVCMIVLSAIIQCPRGFILFMGLVLIGAHNLLDVVHVEGKGALAFIWSLLHDTREFHYGSLLVYVHYPVLPWIGVMLIGYYFGDFFSERYSEAARKRILAYCGTFAIGLFVLLRAINLYGDPSPWTTQQNNVYNFLSFLNVTKYPPSLLYILMTIGPALIFLAFAEKWKSRWVDRISIFGRTAMFYYLAHLLFIHTAAFISTVFCGYEFSDMIIFAPLKESAQLRGYGFNLWVVYLIWLALITILYPLCKWYDGFKRRNISKHWWMSYI